MWLDIIIIIIIKNHLWADWKVVSYSKQQIAASFSFNSISDLPKINEKTILLYKSQAKEYGSKPEVQVKKWTNTREKKKTNFEHLPEQVYLYSTLLALEYLR